MKTKFHLCERTESTKSDVQTSNRSRLKETFYNLLLLLSVIIVTSSVSIFEIQYQEGHYPFWVVLHATALRL